MGNPYYDENPVQKSVLIWNPVHRPIDVFSKIGELFSSTKVTSFFTHYVTINFLASSFISPILPEEISADPSLP